MEKCITVYAENVIKLEFSYMLCDFDIFFLFFHTLVFHIVWNAYER